MRRPNARFIRQEQPDPDKNSTIELDPDNKMDSILIKSFQWKPNPNPKFFPKSLKPQSRSNLLLISLFSIVISIVFCCLFVFFRTHNSLSDDRKFKVIIDGGSTGTRIHIFEYQVVNGLPVFDFGSNGHWSMRLNPGLSSYARDPYRAGESLGELLEFGKGKVPKEVWGDTEIRLMATAGLRLLDVNIQDRILESCRNVIRTSGFKFRDDWATVISGSDEGLYAWVAANYALGTLGGDPHKTTGIIELGGASAQVTFVSSDSIPSDLARTLKYGNVTYNLYSSSLLHFGQNVAYDLVKQSFVSSGTKFARGSQATELTVDPCTPKGYGHSRDSLAEKYSSTFHAEGNYSSCRAAALMLMKKDKENCSYDHCTLGSTFVPKLRGRFLATENFFYTSQFFGLAPKTRLSDLIVAGQQFCQRDWSNIRKEHPSLEEEDLLHYCFSSAYIVAFLHDSLGVALNDQRIRYTNNIGHTPLDWALGAFILHSSSDTNRGGHGWWISSIISDNSYIFCIVGVAIVFIILTWYISQCKKSSVKTIFDLEKGRYIVTRVSR